MSEEQIVYVNFEDLDYEELQDYRKLYGYLKGQLCEGRKTYIFLDEIQKVPDFEKVVDSLYVKLDVDIYITGSNAYMLSGNLAPLLTGRMWRSRCCRFNLRSFWKLPIWMRNVDLRNTCETAECQI